ncbi:MAG TPA: hypothetical protein VLQ46_09870, partial [Casimicrobiaceae bacterium]|nr:hypothetical protein [Casimicrobiaceae bacterium]
MVMVYKAKESTVNPSEIRIELPPSESPEQAPSEQQEQKKEDEEAQSIEDAFKAPPAGAPAKK